MKIEIDLNDILGDEYGAETLQESVRRQVIDSVSATVKKGVGDRIDKAVSETISQNLNIYLQKELPALCASIMEAEYTPISDYGSKGEPTTLRKSLLKTITSSMVYKPTTYSSDKNAFTKAVDAVVESQLAIFKADFNKTVDATFTAAAMQYATHTLKKKLGIE